MCIASFRALALACLFVYSLLVPPPPAGAGGIGVSEELCGVTGDSTSANSLYPVDLVLFHRYKVPFERGPHANRDFEFLWSDTYRALFHMPLDSLSGTPAKNDMDRIGESGCEVWSNPLGLAMTDVELAYNYLAQRMDLKNSQGQWFARDSVYNPLTQSLGFRVAQEVYPDSERTHIDAYIYARHFQSYQQWATYPGDGGTVQWPIKNYGIFPSEYVSSSEDGPAYGSSPLQNNSLQITGPFPSQVARTDATRWTRPQGPANAQLVHESAHAWNNESSGGPLHMFASGAEVLTGVNTDPPRNDVDYHWSLSPTGGSESNAYPHWQSFMAWLAFNWHGVDTSPGGWADDLVRRWATKIPTHRTLAGLALRLSDSECGVECTQYPGFAGLDGVARVQRLIHDWRVAGYVNNSTLPGG